MNIALLYQPRRRSLVWIAFVCALGIHAAAVVIAANKSEPASPSNFQPAGTEIQIENDPAPPTQEPEPMIPTEQPSVENEDAFPTENPTPPPIHPRRKAIAPIARNTALGTATSHFGAVRGSALYAPRPAYPYDARRRKITGSGSVVLTVNRDNGNVIAVRMAQSTGSEVLDNSALSAFRNWRFKPGTVVTVIVPITYTLSGVSY